VVAVVVGGTLSGVVVEVVVVVVGMLTLVAEGTKYSWPSAPLMKVPALVAVAFCGDRCAAGFRTR